PGSWHAQISSTKPAPPPATRQVPHHQPRERGRLVMDHLPGTRRPGGSNRRGWTQQTRTERCRPMTHRSLPRRAARLTAGVGVAALALTGCLGSDENATSADDGSTIRVQALAGPIIEALDVVASAYEDENPGVTVQLESLSNDAARQPNVATLTSSSAPAIGFTQIDSGVYQTLVEAGDLEPREDVWNEADLENRYPEAAQGGVVFNGVPHAVLFAYTLAPVVLYNAEMFDELGIQVPEDRDMSVDQF